MRRIRARQRQIILADARPVVIAGVRGYIDRCADLSIAGVATSTEEILVLLKNVDCDILITDFTMPMHLMNDGLTLLSHIKRNYPRICLIVLTMNMMPAVLYQIIKSGVNAVVHMNDELSDIELAIERASKNTRFIGKSVRDILRSGPVGHLPTKREAEVLRMYADGFTMQEIAIRLNKSIKTIALQKTSAMRKVGLRNDVELGRYSRGAVANAEANYIKII